MLYQIKNHKGEVVEKTKQLGLARKLLRSYTRAWFCDYPRDRFRLIPYTLEVKVS